MNILAPDTREIANGVTLIKEVESDAYAFYVEISMLQSLEITSDFTGSENLYLEGTNTLKNSAVAHPFTKTKIATVKLLDEWKIESKFTCKLIDPPKALIVEAMKTEKKEIRLKIENNKSAFIRYPINLTPLPEIERVLKVSNLVFVDPEFPPLDFYEKVNFSWKRLTSAYPGMKLMPDHIEPFDIILGDGKGYWLKSALEILAERPYSLSRLFITKVVNPLGVYRIKLCKNNSWQVVTIDDYIPYFINGACFLSTTIDKTYWASLLEKAYCKVLGSYEAVNSTSLYEILLDLSGCPCLLYLTDQLQIDYLWDILYSSVEKGFLCCFFGDSPKTPVFSVLDKFVVEERGILKCRNLTEEEVETRWGKNSKLWTAKARTKVSPRFELNSFYIEIDEITEKFSKFLICKLKNWYEFRHKSQFLKTDKSCCKSLVYYSFELGEKAEISVVLQQEDEREQSISHCRGNIDIGLFLLRLKESNEFEIVSMKELVIERNCVLDIELDPGCYIVLPYSSGCLIQAPIEISPEKTKLFLPNGSSHPFFSSALSDVFSKYDKDDEKILTYEKFKIFYEKFGRTLTETDFRQRILKKFQSHNDGLTLEGFKSFIFEQAKVIQEEAVWEWLDYFGYDRDFYSVVSRTYFLTFFSDVQVDVEVRKNSCELENTVFRYLINTGIEFQNDGRVKLNYYLSKQVYCYFYGVINLNEEGCEVTLDCSESENMLFYYKEGIATKFIGSGDIEYIMPSMISPSAKTSNQVVRTFYNRNSKS